MESRIAGIAHSHLDNSPHPSMVRISFSRESSLAFPTLLTTSPVWSFGTMDVTLVQGAHCSDYVILWLLLSVPGSSLHHLISTSSGVALGVFTQCLLTE